MKSEFSKSHYDNVYKLSKEEIAAGEVKVDAYMIAATCRLHEYDGGSGILFHCLKSILRIGRKKSNSLKREIDAITAQIKQLPRFIRCPQEIIEVGSKEDN